MVKEKSCNTLNNKYLHDNLSKLLNKKLIDACGKCRLLWENKSYKDLEKVSLMEKVNVVYSLIYNKENRTILMVQNENGIWTLPGGAVEQNETLKQAAVRETLEETGLEVEVGNIVAINEAFFPERGHHALMITFSANIVSGNIEILNKDEILQIKWFNLETANELMPYHKLGIQPLLESSVPYTFQG